MTKSVRIGILDNAFILGGSPRFASGVGHECTIVGNARVLLETDGMLVKHAGRKVTVNLRDHDVVIMKIE
jgi:hypothetical protein